jgi:hypothetical protein
MTVRNLDKELYELWCTTRVINCFLAEGIYSLEQLLTYSEQELNKIPNFGRKSGREVAEALAARGLKLRDHNTPPPSRQLEQAKHHLEMATQAFARANEEMQKAIDEFTRVENAYYKWR